MPSFGTRLGVAGMSPYTIARLMGHSDIKSSMIYVHTAPDDLRRAAGMAAAKRIGHPPTATRELTTPVN